MALNPDIDLYDEEFNQNLLIAKNLISSLKRKGDKEICRKWIKKLCNLNSSDPTVKKNRNNFFKYMLTVLTKAVDERPEAQQGYPQYDDKFGAVGGGQDPDATFMSKWSADKRTYVAIKPLPAQGALVYMAVAKDPTFGWEYRKSF